MARTRSVKAEKANGTVSEMWPIEYVGVCKTYQLVRNQRPVGSLGPSNVDLGVDRPIVAIQAYIVRM